MTEEELPEPLAHLKGLLDETVEEWVAWLSNESAVASYARRALEEGVWIGVHRNEGDPWFEVDLAPAVVDALELAIMIAKAGGGKEVKG